MSENTALSTEVIEHDGGTEVTAAKPEFQVTKLLQTAGQLELTDEENDILYAKVEEGAVEIRPDGMIYLPWMEYAQRLRKAFGLQWALIPQGDPQINGDFVTWAFWLMIKGQLSGVPYAYGEQQYHPKNSSMSWTDAIEGAKSNALMRLCKGIGIGLELWQPTFIREWKELHAEATWCKNESKRSKGETKQIWTKKGEEIPWPWKPTDPKRKATPPPAPKERSETDMKKHRAWCKEAVGKERACELYEWTYGKVVEGKTVEGLAKIFDHWDALVKIFNDKHPAPTSEEPPPYEPIEDAEFIPAEDPPPEDGELFSESKFMSKKDFNNKLIPIFQALTKTELGTILGKGLTAIKDVVEFVPEHDRDPLIEALENAMEAKAGKEAL